MGTAFPDATKTVATVWKAAPSYTLRVFRDVVTDRPTDVNTDMRRLTTGIRSEKCVFRVVRRFRSCANVTERTHTNLDSIVWPIKHLVCMV